MLLIALLVWVQGLAPFVHAHAGSTHTSGWHLHVVSHDSARGLALTPAHRTALMQTASAAALAPAPPGTEARAVGVAAGLPQNRDTAGSYFRSPPPQDGGWPALPGALPGAPVGSGGARDVAQFPADDVSPRACQARAGLAPPSHAPPALT